jgi:hypothetical protein
LTVKSRKGKGAQGEREVAALWRSYGWKRACPTPGSGSLRPWGAGDIPAWPGDIAFIQPFICEVKRDQKVAQHSRGWEGSAFIRATLRDLSDLADRLNGTVGKRARVRPVGCFRANFQDWRWFIPTFELAYWLGCSEDGGWVELGTSEFFDYALFVGTTDLE